MPTAIQKHRISTKSAAWFPPCLHTHLINTLRACVVTTAAAPNREDAMNTTTQKPKAEEGSNRRGHAGKPTNSHTQRTPRRTQLCRPPLLVTLAEYVPLVACCVALMVLLFG